MPIDEILDITIRPRSYEFFDEDVYAWLTPEELEEVEEIKKELDKMLGEE